MKRWYQIIVAILCCMAPTATFAKHKKESISVGPFSGKKAQNKMQQFLTKLYTRGSELSVQDIIDLFDWKRFCTRKGIQTSPSEFRNHLLSLIQNLDEDPTVQMKEWQAFCDEHDIDYRTPIDLFKESEMHKELAQKNLIKGVVAGALVGSGYGIYALASSTPEERSHVWQHMKSSLGITCAAALRKAQETVCNDIPDRIIKAVSDGMLATVAGLSRKDMNKGLITYIQKDRSTTLVSNGEALTLCSQTILEILRHKLLERGWRMKETSISGWEKRVSPNDALLCCKEHPNPGEKPIVPQLSGKDIGNIFAANASDLVLNKVGNRIIKKYARSKNDTVLWDKGTLITKNQIIRGATHFGTITARQLARYALLEMTDINRNKDDGDTSKLSPLNRGEVAKQIGTGVAKKVGVELTYRAVAKAARKVPILDELFPSNGVPKNALQYATKQLVEFCAPAAIRTAGSAVLGTYLLLPGKITIG